MCLDDVIKEFEGDSISLKLLNESVQKINKHNKNVNIEYKMDKGVEEEIPYGEWVKVFVDITKDEKTLSLVFNKYTVKNGAEIATNRFFEYYEIEGNFVNLSISSNQFFCNLIG